MEFAPEDNIADNNTIDDRFSFERVSIFCLKLIFYFLVIGGFKCIS